MFISNLFKSPLTPLYKEGDFFEYFHSLEGGYPKVGTSAIVEMDSRLRENDGELSEMTLNSICSVPNNCQSIKKKLDRI